MDGQCYRLAKGDRTLKLGRVNVIPKVQDYRVTQEVELDAQGLSLSSSTQELILKGLQVTVTTLQGQKVALNMMKVNNNRLSYSFYASKDVSIAVTYPAKRFS